MAKASVYILNVREDRRQTLLRSEPGWFGGPRASEPVPVFEHSRRAPLIVLASFEDGMLTHIGDARKGASAGTKLVRLNMTSLEELARPIPFEEIAERVPVRFRAPLRKITADGGLLPPKTMKAVIDALSEMDPELAAKLERFSSSRDQLIAELG